MKKLKKQINDYVGAGIVLGVGAYALENMGQGQIANKVITPAANMLGPVASAGIGMSVLNTINTETKRLHNKHKRR